MRVKILFQSHLVIDFFQNLFVLYFKLNSYAGPETKNIYIFYMCIMDVLLYKARFVFLWRLSLCSYPLDFDMNSLRSAMLSINAYCFYIYIHYLYYYIFSMEIPLSHIGLYQIVENKIKLYYSSSSQYTRTHRRPTHCYKVSTRTWKRFYGITKSSDFLQDTLQLIHFTVPWSLVVNAHLFIIHRSIEINKKNLKLDT